MNGYTEFQHANFKQQEMLAQADQRRLEEIALSAVNPSRPQPLARLLQFMRPMTVASPDSSTALIPAENRVG
ncbi:MAG: hypothetical protein J0M33_06220 [Anaerolineae bacterium]|nr:hypothetical protein [Anaerolineae bacterium]